MFATFAYAIVLLYINSSEFAVAALGPKMYLQQGGILIFAVNFLLGGIAMQQVLQKKLFPSLNFWRLIKQSALLVVMNFAVVFAAMAIYLFLIQSINNPFLPIIILFAIMTVLYGYAITLVDRWVK